MKRVTTIAVASLFLSTAASFGQQAKPAPCSSLGAIPRGAFVLFDGKAYDADYDWVMESRKSKVPAEILALRRGAGGSEVFDFDTMAS